MRVGKEEITFQVNVEIEATTEVDFSFQIYDSVDKDYVSIGGAHKSISSTFPSSLLVTVIGDFFVEPPVYDIESTELIDGPTSVEFGDVGPDYSDDRD